MSQPTNQVSSMEHSGETNPLLVELIQGLINEVSQLKKTVASQPQATNPPDLGPPLEKVAKAIVDLRQEVRQPVLVTTPPTAAPVVDLSGITAQLKQLSYEVRQRPDYRISQYVRYGAYAFGFLVVLVAGLTWLCLDLKQERDHYEVANWKWRYTTQDEPDLAAFVNAKFPGDSIKPVMTRWIIDLELADEKRGAARKAQEQARVLAEQANLLERKTNEKGKKKAESATR